MRKGTEGFREDTAMVDCYLDRRISWNRSILLVMCLRLSLSNGISFKDRNVRSLFDNPKIVLFLCTGNYYRSRFAE
jgi:hypothetical protein